jgi:hypothetical protein
MLVCPAGSWATAHVRGMSNQARARTIPESNRNHWKYSTDIQTCEITFEYTRYVSDYFETKEAVWEGSPNTTKGHLHSAYTRGDDHVA